MFKVFLKFRRFISLIAYVFCEGKNKFGNGVKFHEWFNSELDSSIRSLLIFNLLLIKFNLEKLLVLFISSLNYILGTNFVIEFIYIFYKNIFMNKFIIY